MKLTIPETGLNYTISVTKNNNHINQNTKELSILVSMYGLSFMIQNDTQKKFFEYPFTFANPVTLQQKVSEILAERPVLRETFDLINLIYHNRLNALVPTDFFEPELAKDLLAQQIKLQENDYVNYNYIESLQAFNLYVPYHYFETSFFKDNFKRLMLKHSATHFFENISVIKKQTQDLPVFEVFLNIFPRDFQIAVYKNESLQAYNHFEYSNTDEFLYYLFFMLETLDVKPHQSRLYIFGTDAQNEILDQIRLFNDNIKVVPGLNPSQIYNYF